MWHELVIIGSGFGGSACALRAARAGCKPVVLERGGPMGDARLARIAEGRESLLHGSEGRGLVVAGRYGRLGCVTASAVGGGSHVYTAVTAPPPAEVFAAHWPVPLGLATLEPCLRRAAEIIQATVLTEPPPRTRHLEAGAARMPAPVTRLPLAIEANPEPGSFRTTGMLGKIVTWLRGGARTRKRTLDRSYLAEAIRHGADVRPWHEVRAIVPLAGGYRLLVRRWIDGGWRDDFLQACRVVCAAGTLGTLRLLLTCRDRHGTLPRLSAALGRRFFTNGDCGALLLLKNSSGLAPDDGPPVTAWVDLWQSDRLYLMETGVLPTLPSLAGWGAQLLGGRIGRNGRHRVPWAFGVMGLDESAGKMSLSRSGGLRYLPPRHRTPYGSRVRARLTALAGAMDAVLLTLPARLQEAFPITVHPLGGAALADRPADGVADPFGEVFGYPGLFIADGSLLPTPSGVAPSMTIAALGEWVIEHLLKRAGAC